jgi:hypothetical protein
MLISSDARNASIAAVFEDGGTFVAALCAFGLAAGGDGDPQPLLSSSPQQRSRPRA